MASLTNAGSVVVPQKNSIPFYTVIAYLFLEFARPQVTFPFLEALHLPGVVITLLLFMLFAGGKANFSDPSTKWFIALLAIMAPHIPLATNNYWAFHTARAMLISFAAYLGLITYVNSLDRFKILLHIWLGIHVYLAVMGLVHGGRGLGGFLGDENDFCLVLNMVLPIAFFMAISETRRFRKMVYLGLALLFVATVVVAFSRGGFLGLCAVGLYVLMYSPKKIPAIVGVGLVVLFLFFFAPGTYWEEVQSIYNKADQGTGEERTYTWKVGWAMFLDNPIWGVGQGNFPYRFGQYEQGLGFNEGLHGRSRAGRAAHSLYFTLMPELGVVGVVIFLRILFLLWKDLAWLAMQGREDPSVMVWSRALAGSLVGYLVTGTFISVFYYPCFWVVMGFIVALKNAARTSLGNENCFAPH
jgi:O-antigen ligase